MKNILIISLLLLSVLTRAQDTTSFFKHEVGINLSEILVIVRRPEGAHLLNYKYHFKNGIALRCGVNFNYEQRKAGVKEVDFRVGIEKETPVKILQVFYGIDFGYAHLHYNTKNNTVTRYVAAPLLGFRRYIIPRFSVSTEVKFTTTYIVNRDPESFSKEANLEEFKAALGPVGIILLNFRF